MENTNGNNLFDFLDDEFLGKGLQQIRKFFVKDFARFSAISAVCFSIAIWITRSLGYFYMLGRFSVYNIDKSYIDVWSEGFLIQIIQSASILILLLAVNYKYFQLSVQKDGSKLKRKFKKLGFILLEFITLNSWVLFTNGISLIGLLKELRNTPIKEIIVLVFVWVLVLVMINIYGIEATFFYKRFIKGKKIADEDENELKIGTEKKSKNKKKKHKKQNNKALTDVKQSDKKYQRWIKVIEILLITCIIEFGFMFCLGVLAERQKSEFKFVAEKEETTEGDKYLFTDEENGDSYYLYPIIYENQDVYILSKIYRDEDCLTIDYDFLQVIDKEDVSTYYVDNLQIESNYFN